MSLTDRARVHLSERDEMILLGLLQGWSIKKVSKRLVITESTVLNEQKKLQIVFGAKTTIHLLVLAILERKYYDQLWFSGTNHVSDDLSEREVKVAVYLLQGYINKEIADMMNVSVRTVEFHRKNFYAKCHVGSYKDFILACIYNGILKITPFEYRMAYQTSGERSLRTFKRSKAEFHVDFWFFTKHHHGFIYFDYQNRFTWCVESGLRNNSNTDADLLFLATDLSEVRHSHLKRGNKKLHLNHLLSSGTSDSYMQFFEYLTTFGFKLISGSTDLNPVDRMSRALVLTSIAERKSLEERSSSLGISIEELRKQEVLLYKEFNCESEATLIMQGLHMGMILEDI